MINVSGLCNTHIFIRSHEKDFPWLTYALHSIERFCVGFTGVTVIVPDRDQIQMRRAFSADYKTKFYTYATRADKYMLEGELKLCHAEEIIPSATDYVLLTDSDCIFKKPATPQDYLIGGKPVLLGIPFTVMTNWNLDYARALCRAIETGNMEIWEHLQVQNYIRNYPGQMFWWAGTKAAMGIEIEFEFMVRHPAIYPTWIFPLFRQAVEKHTGQRFDDYVLSCRDRFPQTFAELTSLGAYAYYNHRDEFHFLDTSLPESHTVRTDSGNLALDDHLKQYWGGDPVEKHRPEIEGFLK